MEEAADMKKLMFKNYMLAFEPTYSVAAEKECTAINQQLSKEFKYGISTLGEEKVPLESVIKDNAKEYRALARVPGFGSPNKRFMELFKDSGGKGAHQFEIMAAAGIGMGRDLTLAQLQ